MARSEKSLVDYFLRRLRLWANPDSRLSTPPDSRLRLDKVMNKLRLYMTQHPKVPGLGVLA